jgi:predicted AAA+ superfamily ATPase
MYQLFFPCAQGKKALDQFYMQLKNYFSIGGFSAVQNGLVQANSLGISPQWGSLFENQIYLDLRRRGKKVKYYLTEEGFEIDFVVENIDGSLELLQAVWDKSDESTLEREKRALDAAEKELGIKGRIITPQDYILECLKEEKF